MGLHKKPCIMKNFFLALACLLTSLTAHAAQLTEAQRQAADRTIDILTKAYEANKRLSYDDGLALLKYAELNHQLNLAAGPILRDTFDPGIDADTWLRRHREGMVQCASKVLQMKAKLEMMDDRGAKATIMPILQGNQQFLAGLRLIQNCYAGSPGNPADGVAMIRAGINRRKEAGLPIVKKLRDLSGSDEFDKAAVKILEDTARAVSR
jgi:hypothetical protein